MPKVVDNYVFQRKIGSGQYGDVYKGYNKNDNTDIAIKAINRQNIKGKFLQLLENEIKVLKTCDNKNIIKLYDIKKTANNFYLILEYCNEGDLSQHLKKNKKFPEKEAIQFFVQILSGFKTLYKHKIMHRDFKLANILLHDGEIKIADFGFSKLLSEEEFAETMLGSPLNMAPQVLGGTQYNIKADIWSIGVVFYQMLFGSPPYKAANMVELVNNIKTKPLRFPKEINAISPETEDVLKKMLTVDPNKRIDWQKLFAHPINHLLEDQVKKQMENTMGQSEDITLNASKFYLKTNMIVEHPKEIEKNQNINNYAYDVVNKKKPQTFKGQIIKRDQLRKKSVQKKQAPKQQEISKQESTKDIIGDEETLREKQIKAFKRNSKYLLHRRNIYVLLASIAEQTMTIGRETELSDIVGYLLIRKLLQLLLNLKELMQTKDAKQINLQYWEQFQGEKDFVDIKMYVWKEYDVFKVYYKTFDDRIREKTKMLNTQLQEVVNNPNSPLNEKVYQRYLREYLRTLFASAKKISFQEEKSERKFYAHHLRIIDSLNLEDVFYFQRNGAIFNFHNYYQEPIRMELQDLKKQVNKRMSYI